MTDESSLTKQQRNMGAVNALMMTLGLLASVFGTSGLFRTRELFSWYTLLILGGLFLSVGSLVWIIKNYRKFPRTSAKYDIRFGLAFFAGGFALIVCLVWLKLALGNPFDDWGDWSLPAFFVLGGFFVLGRGLYKRSQEGLSGDSLDAAPEPTIAPEATNPPPAEDE